MYLIIHLGGEDASQGQLGFEAIGSLAIGERDRCEPNTIHQQFLQRLPRLDDVASQHFAEASKVLGKHPVEVMRIVCGCRRRPLERRDLRGQCVRDLLLLGEPFDEYDLVLMDGDVFGKWALDQPRVRPSASVALGFEEADSSP
jgi:hypothetical protein